MPDKLIIYAPAKLNLFLKVLGRRKDGYHSIRSGITFINLFDEIEISKTSKTSINYFGSFRPENGNYKDCIIAKTLQFISLNNNINLEINIKKNIPVQAGLGSASTNAAALLKGLNKLQLLNLQNFDTYSKLGADVPCFLFEKNCLVEGIGDKISHQQFPKYFFLLVKPKINCSTEKMYKQLGYSIGTVKEDLCEESNEINENDIGNDFENIIIQKSFEIKKILDFLGNLEEVIFTRMTGSGSCCYAAFANEEHALKAKENFISNFSNLWTFVAKNNSNND